MLDLYDETKSLKDIMLPEDWMTTREVAQLFGVDPRTVIRWTDKLSNVRNFKTPGGNMRYYRPDVQIALEQHENNKSA
jgi:predicted site-specific integrase-resolvase